MIKYLIWLLSLLGVGVIVSYSVTTDYCSIVGKTIDKEPIVKLETNIADVSFSCNYLGANKTLITLQQAMQLLKEKK